MYQASTSSIKTSLKERDHPNTDKRKRVSIHSIEEFEVQTCHNNLYIEQCILLGQTNYSCLVSLLEIKLSLEQTVTMKNFNLND